MTRLGGFGVPGAGAIELTTEREILWGGDAAKGMAIYKSAVMDGTARDAGNTPTTVLRPGLLLGIITATGQYKEYNPAGTDGSEVASLILSVELRAQDFDANNADRVFPALCAGPVKAGQLLLLDVQARGQLQRQFLFDDDLIGNINPFPQVVAKTAAYTVTAADNNTVFTTQGAAGTVAFTLPTLARGLRYRFFNEAAEDMTVASVVTDEMVAFNDLTADSVGFTTASEEIGGAIEVMANADATKWIVFMHLGAETQTPAIAT